MKVKELIQWLQKQNPEDFVGLLDYGQDSGDWGDLQPDEDFGCGGNFKILSYDEAVKKMKKDYSKYELKKFKERYAPSKTQGVQNG